MIRRARPSRRARGTPELERPVPTAEQIREMTAQIRSSWTPRERRRRANAAGDFEIEPLPLQPRRKGFWGD